MGWTGIPNFRGDKLETIKAEFSADVKILKTAKVGNTYFLAVKSDDGIYAYVAVTSTKKGQFLYAIMRETSEPYHTGKCPESILKLLSPPINAYSANWRKKQRASLVPQKIKDGAVIQTATPLKFNGVGYLDTFVKEGRHWYAYIRGQKIRVAINKGHFERAGGCTIIGTLEDGKKMVKNLSKEFGDTE